MDALKRAKSERAGHRGIVTKVFKEVQAFVANPVDSDDVQAVSQRLRDLQLCAQKLRREQEQLPALNLRFQAELTEEQELEADIVNADDLDTQLELNLLQLDDAISLLKPGSSLPPPRLSVSSPPPSVATNAQPGFASADVSSVHVRLPKLTLPTFSGDPLDWQSFWDTFAASVHSNTSLSGVQKFQYLRGQLTGAAARYIAGLTATNQHYTHAVELLRQRFGQPHKITSAHMEALIHMAPPSASHRDLRSFFDRVSCHVRGLEAAGRTANSYGDCLVPILLERLPATTRQQLTRDHGTTEWEIGALLAALRKEIEILELGPSLDDATPQPTMNFATMARRGQRQGSASRSSRTPRCAFCDRPHPSSQCSTVTDPQQRRDTVKSKGLCFNCLGPHRVSTCPTKVRCRTCGQKHHTTLCMPQQPPTQRSHATVASSTAPQPQPDQPGQSAQPAQPTPASHVACATSVHPAACLAAGQSVILQTASTTVYAEQGNRSASVRLLLDSGSQRTYMSRRLAESLHLQPALHEPLSISTFGDTRPFTVDTYLVNFQLGLKDGSRLDVNANVIPDITGSIYRGSTPPEDEAFLRDLSPGMLADCLPSDQDDAKVDLLIGSDLFWDLVSSDRIVLPSGLLLLSSKLGYILTGKCNTAQPAKEVGTLIAHTPVLQSGLIPTYTACADSCVSSSPNLTDFWSLETIGIKDDPSPSPDDQIGQDFENSVRFEDGRYEVRWPWKDNATDLPENFGLAFGRLKSLSRRFQQDPALLQRYDSVITALQLKKTHPLARQLHLRLDGFNILRCHSRLANADLSFDTKCPILLPRKTPFATLVVLDIHRRLLHSGVSHTLSELQRTYWLCHGRAEVRRILSSCIICKRHEGPAFRLPPMPALTKERVTRSRPFQFVGLDYLGPLVVNDRGERVKVWICLFTCLAVRAIHLECATGLSSAQFLACLRRFVARRGCPDQIICDNAPQFKLARTTLERQWDHRVASHAADNNITWHFITEHAPWQGGFYERLVGLCKRALRKSINRRLLHLSDLTTLVTEVEATLNSRPLTYVDQDVDSGVTITPAHFLSLSPAPRLSLPSGADVAETADAQLYPPATDPAEELRRTWQASMTTLEYFWSIWEREYLQLLRQTTISRQHHQHSTVNRTPQVNDIVIVKSDEQPRASWKLGRVMAVNQSHDTLIRSARVLMPNHRVLTRPVNQLFPLELHCVSQPAPAQPAPDSTSSAATRPARSAALDAQRRLADLFCDTSS